MNKIIVILLIFTSIQQANDFHFLYQFSYGVGGDTIVKYENVEDIKLGTGTVDALGVSFNPFSAMSKVAISLTIGYSTTGSIFNDRYYLSKIPVTLTENYTYNEHWRLGAGITYHMNHKGHKVNTSLENIKFDDAIGGVFSVGYVFGKNKKTYLGIRSTLIDYDINNVTLNGNRFSMMIEQKF